MSKLYGNDMRIQFLPRISFFFLHFLYSDSMILRILFLVSSIFFLAGCGKSPEPSSIISGEVQGSLYRTSIDPDERIALAKKRKSYMSGIRKGDFYSLRNAPEDALSYYLTVAEKIPDDLVVRKKIAHVYFLLKNWQKSYSEYSQVPVGELSTEERNELFQSLFFDGTRVDRMSEISRYTLGTGALDWYQAVDTCYSGIHNCVISLDAYTGSSENVLALKKQIKNAKKITDAREYRNLLILAKLYEQSMYRASVKIAEEILREFPDYTEVKKIIAFSYFELGEYEDAKKYLLSYLEKNPNDLESIVRMGEIQYALSDYIASNLYLNNAILAGYTPKTNLERRLAYNYSLLSDSVGMMKVLGYLLQEEDVTEDDFAVAITAALTSGDFTRAKSWSDIGSEKFPDSLMLGPLAIRVARESGE